MRLQHLTAVRRFVAELADSVVRDSELAARLALATHELLENAVKYNIDDATMLRVTMTPQTESTSEVAVTIRTRNRATPENLRIAERLITQVREAEDPFMFYQQLIIASAEASEGSGLGLARIRAETEMTIDFTIEGDQIEIVAHAQVRTGGDA